MPRGRVWPFLHYFCVVVQLPFLLQQYLNCSEKLYEASLQTVDFEWSAEETRKTINAWVESKTNGMDKSHMFLQILFELC